MPAGMLGLPDALEWPAEPELLVCPEHAKQMSSLRCYGADL